MQAGKQGQTESLIDIVKWFHSICGTTEILESSSVDDLNSAHFIFSKQENQISFDIYPMLVAFATEQASEFQRELIYKLSDGWNDVDQMDQDYEPETPEQTAMRLQDVKQWREMNPRDFWLMMMK